MEEYRVIKKYYFFQTLNLTKQRHLLNCVTSSIVSSCIILYSCFILFYCSVPLEILYYQCAEQEQLNFTFISVLRS